MKVLVADDDPVSRRLLQNYLQKWGYEVSVAANGAEAWQLFEREDFQMVISDWMMPELDGLDLIRRIRQQPLDHYVFAILLTSRSQKDDFVAGMEAGADDFVSKPFDQDELHVRLRAGERIVNLELALKRKYQAMYDALSSTGPGDEVTAG
jgi:DNA-binding response OmpR family regulator